MDARHPGFLGDDGGHGETHVDEGAGAAVKCAWDLFVDALSA